MTPPASRGGRVLPLDATWLPYRIDVVMRRVLWVRMDAAQRARAAFLDERALSSDAEGRWAPMDTWPAVDAQAPCDAIFHIGHCGSTLLSRALGTWPGLQVLREPMALRALAAEWPTRGADEAWVSEVELDALVDRTWDALARAPDATRTLVKATSGCNALIEPLLARRGDARVVLLDMPLRDYLATLLKSPASMGDALIAAPERLRDLRARGLAGGVALHALDASTQCAMGWLAERVRFDALARAWPARVLRVDFNGLLADRGAQLQCVAGFLGLPPGHVDAASRDAVWGQYAKADAHAYTVADRSHDLALSLQRNRAAIERSVAWVSERVARDARLQSVVGDAVTHAS